MFPHERFLAHLFVKRGERNWIGVSGVPKPSSKGLCQWFKKVAVGRRFKNWGAPPAQLGTGKGLPFLRLGKRGRGPSRLRERGGTNQRSHKRSQLRGEVILLKKRKNRQDLASLFWGKRLGVQSRANGLADSERGVEVSLKAGTKESHPQ